MNEDKNEIVNKHVTEIENMRQEINWRVKSAYTASIIFIGASTTVAGSLYSSDNKLFEELERNSLLLCNIQMAAIVLVSAWAGVQNANHIIEKKIELYSLSLMKKVVNVSGQVYSSWLGYLYGSPFHKGRINGFSKLVSASIGLFIYILPNAVALILWMNLLYQNAEWNVSGLSRFYFVATTAFMFAAVASAFLFFFYMLRVNREFTDFYNHYMIDYFDYEMKSFTKKKD